VIGITFNSALKKCRWEGLRKPGVTEIERDTPERGLR
jgi:hypothetical protein